jgi:hypothetical protein
MAQATASRKQATASREFSAHGPNKRAWRDEVIRTYRDISGHRRIPASANMLTLGGPQWVDSEFEHVRNAGLLRRDAQYVSVETDFDVSERNRELYPSATWIQGCVGPTFIPAKLIGMPFAFISLDLMCGGKLAARTTDNLLARMRNPCRGRVVLAVNCMLEIRSRPWQKLPSRPETCFNRIPVHMYDYTGDSGSKLRTIFYGV